MRLCTRRSIVALALACTFVAPRLHAETPDREGAHWRLELAAAPLLGIELPLKGCFGSFLGSFVIEPFELGLGVGGAYEAALNAGSLRLDLSVALGSGLRAILGGLILFGEHALPGAGDARVVAEASDWPNRFGIGASIVELPIKLLGARLGIDAQLVYNAYRLAEGSASNGAALAGAAVFAASVEACVALRFRWDYRGRSHNSSLDKSPAHP
jgi:hypothetical protein